ncbi:MULTISPECIES: helix-turn-helix transcriptional regulator [Flavihumibacter]|uniref:helix-turn-helix transcriptional regulator n=1 Tax=Flavihumibacter TaxID=1004301 RepID=UPI001EF9257D|nr:MULTISPECIES: helix-turn-helix transcriptional regulator [Flavihumibacter]MCG7752216.1 helix-turn-helix transcriptional regulator [Flavihumibacter cheonanensis]
MSINPFIHRPGAKAMHWQLDRFPGFQVYRFMNEPATSPGWAILAKEPLLYWTICLQGALRLRTSTSHQLLPAHMALISCLREGKERWQIGSQQPASGWVFQLSLREIKDWLTKKVASNWWPYFVDPFSDSVFKEHSFLLTLQQERFFQQLSIRAGPHFLVEDQLALEQQAFQLLEQLVLTQATGSVTDLADEEERVLALVPYILQELDKPITLSILLHFTGMNVLRLQTLCKQLYGQSLHSFVQLMRIEKAKELLLHSNESILAVGIQVGFSSPSYFSRVFKQRVGVEPRVFRKRGIRATA